MKKIILASASALLFCSLSAQTKPEINWPDYEFTTVKSNPVTSVKNQNRSGTCWCYSTTSFIESEIIRINNITDPGKYPDLSEFFTVSHSYFDRAVKYVRLEGRMGFSAGSESGDVMHVVKDFGLVPDSEMTGMNYGTSLPTQAELDAVLKGYADAIVRNPNGKLTTAWKNGFQGILDAYLGKCPETFTVDGKEYTPASYRDFLKFNPDDYLSFTSFTHHPFYKECILELADNWRWDADWNVPLDDLINIIDSAINAGYTIAWGTDVSEPGFTRNGLAVLVDVDATSKSGSDQEHWVGGEEKSETAVNEIVEKSVSQEDRQIQFDDKTLTDDHGMQIFGIARDQFGAKYYMVKNSWGEKSKYNGIWYASEAFVKAQTISILVHKNAVPKAIKSKIGVQ